MSKRKQANRPPTPYSRIKISDDSATTIRHHCEETIEIGIALSCGFRESWAYHTILDSLSQQRCIKVPRCASRVEVFLSALEMVYTSLWRKGQQANIRNKSAHGGTRVEVEIRSLWHRAKFVALTGKGENTGVAAF